MLKNQTQPTSVFLNVKFVTLIYISFLQNLSLWLPRSGDRELVLYVGYYWCCLC